MNYLRVSQRIPSSTVSHRVSVLRIVSSWLGSGSSSSSSITVGGGGSFRSSSLPVRPITVVPKRTVHTERRNSRYGNSDNPDASAGVSNTGTLPLPKILEETEYVLRTIREIQERYETIQAVFWTTNEPTVPSLLHLHNHYRTAIQGLFHYGLMYECLMLIEKYTTFLNFYSLTVDDAVHPTKTAAVGEEEEAEEFPSSLQHVQSTIAIQAHAWLNNRLAPPDPLPGVLNNSLFLPNSALKHNEILSVLQGYILHQRWNDLYRFTGIMIPTAIPTHTTASEPVILTRSIAIEYVLEAWLEISRKYLTNYSSSSSSSSIVTGSVYRQQFSQTTDGIHILYDCIHYYYTYILGNASGNKQYSTIMQAWYRYGTNLLRYTIDNLCNVDTGTGKPLVMNLWTMIYQHQQLFIDGVQTMIGSLSGSSSEQYTLFRRDITRTVQNLPWSPSLYGSFLRAALHYKDIHMVQRLINQLDSSLFDLWKYSTFASDTEYRNYPTNNNSSSIRNENDIVRICQDTLPKLSVHKDSSKLYGFLLRIVANTNKSLSSTSTTAPMDTIPVLQFYSVQNYLSLPMVRQIIRLLLDNQLYSDTLSFVQLLVRQYLIRTQTSTVRAKQPVSYEQFCANVQDKENFTGTFAGTLDSSALLTQPLNWSVKSLYDYSNHLTNDRISARTTGIFTLLFNAGNDASISVITDPIGAHPLQDSIVFRAVIHSLYFRQQPTDLLHILTVYDKVWKTCMLEDMDYFLGQTSRNVGIPILHHVLEIAMTTNDKAFVRDTLTYILKNISSKTGGNKYIQHTKGTPEVIRLLCLGFESILPDITDDGVRFSLYEQLLTMNPSSVPVAAETSKVLTRLLIPVYRDKIFQSSPPSLSIIMSTLQKLAHQKIKVSPQDGAGIMATVVGDPSSTIPVVFPFQFLHRLVQYDLIETVHTTNPSNGHQILYSLSAGLANYTEEVNDTESMVLQHVLKYVYNPDALIEHVSSNDFRILYGMMNKRYHTVLSNDKGSHEYDELRNVVNAGLTFIMYGNAKENTVWTKQDYTDLYQKVSHVLTLFPHRTPFRSLASANVYLGRTLRVLLDNHNEGIKIPYPLNVGSSSIEDIVSSLVSENEGWTISRILSFLSVPGAPNHGSTVSSPKGFSIMHNALTIPSTVHSRVVQAFEKNLGLFHLSASSGSSSGINDIYRYVLQNMDENMYFDKHYAKHVSANKPTFNITGTKVTTGGSPVPWITLLQGTVEQRKQHASAYLMFNEICSTTDQQRVSVTNYPASILKVFPWSSKIDANDYQVWNSLVSTGGNFDIPETNEAPTGSTDVTKLFTDSIITTDSPVLQKVSLQQLTVLMGHCLTEAPPLFPFLAIQLLRHGAFIVPSIADQLALLTKHYPSLTIPLLTHLRLQFVTVIGNLPWSLMAQTKVSVTGTGCSSLGVNAILESLVKARQLHLALELLDEVAPISRQQVAPNKPSTLKMVPVNWWAPDVQILQRLQTLAEELQEKQVGKMVSVLIRSMVRTVPQEHPHERKPVGVPSSTPSQ